MPSSSSPLFSAKWKGKGKQVTRDDDSGGSAGSILLLDVVQNSIYDVAYTLPVLVGTSQQNFSLQVDTGSSDLWIASTSCSSSVCGKTGGILYNPSGATQTGQTFVIEYLQGSVSGPIVWDQVSVGGYTISNQALAAADDVQSEPLSRDFQGVLGLALPLNSVIADLIPPTTGNNPDGAAFASNLFGITPSSEAPSARFLSLSLSRPGSDQIPALLGIGQHPPEVVSDPSKIKYATLLSENDGILFWKATVRAITVYVDDQVMPIAIGSSVSGRIYPTATLDTGVPLILTTSEIANGIYGAIGINPANDGQYYVPCTQPLNLTITLDNRPEIAIHPLDLTGEPPEGSASSYCIGLIQAADAQLNRPNSDTGDMILGVPFLRNVYTVMAYDPPDSQGAFNASRIGSIDVNPRLGLLNLTDPTVALEEFKRVRVDNQPLSPSSSPYPTHTGPDKKLSVGIYVLFGLLSFVAVCFILFAGRWFISKWTSRQRSGLGEKKAAFGSYRLTRRGSRSSMDDQPTEDTLRHLRYEGYVKKERIASQYTTTDSARTRVNSDIDPDLDTTDGELGYRKSQLADSTLPSGAVVSLDETLVAINNRSLPVDADGSPDSDDRTSLGSRRRQQAQRSQSISLPLLVHERGASNSSEEDLAEFGAVGRESMAGIGTAARGSRIDQGIRQGSSSSLNGVLSSVVTSNPVISPPRRFPSGPRPLPVGGHSADS